MAASNKKYMDVDVIVFLEKQMKMNTVHYQSDFEIDKQKIDSCVKSEHWQDKTLLWLSRHSGTECVTEADAFIQGTDAHIRWRYYAEQRESNYLAFAVELTGVKDGIIRGNCYALDYAAHAEEVAKSSVDITSFQKTFADGLTLNVPLESSTYFFYKNLVEEHGAIVHTLGEPKDKDLHRAILAEQRVTRSKFREAPSKVSLADKIKVAEAKASGIVSSHSGPEKVVVR